MSFFLKYECIQDTLAERDIIRLGRLLSVLVALVFMEMFTERDICEGLSQGCQALPKHP